MAAENIVFYQHDDCPYLIVKATDTFYFERFDLDTKKWVLDDDKFYRVYEDDDYHRITEEQVDDVISRIPDGLSDMSDEEAYEKLSSAFADKQATA